MTLTNKALSLALALGATLAVGCGHPPPPPPPMQPPPPPPPVVVAPTKLEVDLVGAQLDIKTDIEFDVAKAAIRDNPASRTTIDAVFAILRKVPRITKIRIEGHTDSDGNPGDNERLSEERARAVGAKLVSMGVDPGRLSFAGCGARDPLVANDSAEHKQRNRRTEFDIEAIDGHPPDGHTLPCAPNKHRH